MSVLAVYLNPRSIPATETTAKRRGMVLGFKAYGLLSIIRNM